MKTCYVPKRFTNAHKSVIARANAILEEYTAQGFVLTLRQLYYQHVARGYIANNMREYKRLGDILGDARLAGLVDWEHIEDRTRSLKELTHFSGPQDALDRLAGWYHIDLWANQQYRPEVWIEKDALAGVITGVCQENDVPYFSCRGYTSLSEMWRASERLRGYARFSQTPYIIHFGDHDPSGIDMSRDIMARLRETFMADCDFHRVALTMAQVEEYSPPPNPAKVTDSRFQAYLRKYGDESWELDALEPTKFRELIEAELKGLRDEKVWKEDVKAKEQVRKQLQSVAKDWNEIGGMRNRLATAEKSLVDSEESLRKVKEDLARERAKARNGRKRGKGRKG